MRDGKTGKAKAKAGGTHRVQWAEENKDARMASPEQEKLYYAEL